MGHLYSGNASAPTAEGTVFLFAMKGWKDFDGDQLAAISNEHVLGDSKEWNLGLCYSSLQSTAHSQEVATLLKVAESDQSIDVAYALVDQGLPSFRQE